jgi:hypothetical protein
MNRYFKKVKYFFGFIFNFFVGGKKFSKNRRNPALFILVFLGFLQRGRKIFYKNPQKSDSQPIRNSVICTKTRDKTPPLRRGRRVQALRSTMRGRVILFFYPPPARTSWCDHSRLPTPPQGRG